MITILWKTYILSKYPKHVKVDYGSSFRNQFLPKLRVSGKPLPWHIKEKVGIKRHLLLTIATRNFL
jgi:hypothetical protein